MPPVREGGAWTDPLKNVRVAGKWQQHASFDLGLARWSWGYNTGTLKIVAVDGRRTLEYSNAAGLAHASWSGNGPKADLLLYARFRRVYTGTDSLAYGIAARLGGTVNARKGVILRSVQGTLRLNRYSGSSLVDPGAHPSLPTQLNFSNTPGRWLNVKLQVIGNEYLGKGWSDGDPEPGWQVGARDANTPDAGQAGLFTGSGGGTYQCSRFITAPL